MRLIRLKWSVPFPGRGVTHESVPKKKFILVFKFNGGLSSAGGTPIPPIYASQTQVRQPSNVTRDELNYFCESIRLVID